MQVARRQQALAVKQARVLREHQERLGHHGPEEHAGVHLPVKAAADGPAAGRQIQRRADRGDAGNDLPGSGALFSRPAHQRIAAQGNTHGQHRPAVLACKASEQPVNLGIVTRVVGARRQIDLARAAAKVRNGTGPAARAGRVGKGLGIVAGRRALQAVKDDQ